MAEITSTPGVLGGKPRIADTRISVLDVVELLEAGYTISDVSEQLGVTCEEVRTATRYYRLHKSELDEALQARAGFPDALDETPASAE